MSHKYLLMQMYEVVGMKTITSSAMKMFNHLQRIEVYNMRSMIRLYGILYVTSDIYALILQMSFIQICIYEDRGRTGMSKPHRPS